MDDSIDNTNDLENYGVWVKHSAKDENDLTDSLDSLDLPDFPDTDTFDDTDFSDMFKDDSQFTSEKKLEDFEFASDGRITKVNNWKSGKKVFLIYGYDNIVDGFARSFLENCIKLGIVYATEESRDKAMFKLEIETKLKNIAERLNKEEKIIWDNKYQNKYYIYYKFTGKTLDFDYNLFYKQQGCIYCLSDKFLKEAKKEISEENLIKYFKD